MNSRIASISLPVGRGSTSGGGMLPSTITFMTREAGALKGTIKPRATMRAMSSVNSSGPGSAFASAPSERP